MPPLIHDVFEFFDDIDECFEIVMQSLLVQSLDNSNYHLISLREQPYISMVP